MQKPDQQELQGLQLYLGVALCKSPCLPHQFVKVTARNLRLVKELGTFHINIHDMDTACFYATTNRRRAQTTVVVQTRVK